MYKTIAPDSLPLAPSAAHTGEYHRAIFETNT